MKSNNVESEHEVPWNDYHDHPSRETVVLVPPGPQGPMGPDGSVMTMSMVDDDSRLPYGFDYITPLSMRDASGREHTLQVAHSHNTWVGLTGESLRRGAFVLVRRTPDAPGPTMAEAGTRRVVREQTAKPR